MVQAASRDAPAPRIDAPDSFLGYTVARLAAVMQARMDAALRSGADLSVRQFGILAHLASDPGMGSGQLARLVMVTPQSMGPLVDRLADMGLVERSTASRGQRRQIRLTDGGWHALKRGYAVANALAEEEKAILGDDTFGRLNAMLLRLLGHLQETDIAPGE